MLPNPLFFAIILACGSGLFCISLFRRLSLVAGAAPEDRFDKPWARVRALLTYAVGQKRVMAKPFGFNHVVIFWAFLLLLAANAEFLLKGVAPSLSFARLPAPIHHLLLLVFDTVSLAALVSAIIAMVRRLVAPPFREARTGEAFVILGMIALLMLANFGLHGAEIALGKEPAAVWMPVSQAAAALLAPLPASGLESWGVVCWWLHALVLLTFMNYLPLSKHMHILTALPNCFFRSLDKPNTQPREEFRKGGRLGVASVSDFTWKDLLDSFTCTECGRCQNACPAHATGKALNPRQVMQVLKNNLLLNSALSGDGVAAVPLIGGPGEGSVSEEALWDCTTCGACLEQCPVLIEQMPKIVKMRRHLVQMEARFPEELLNLFENMEQRSNPWGIAPSERSKWHSTVEVKPFRAGETEYLFYVGCAGAFDSRSKQVTVAMTSILDAAGVSWGILGKEEKCCGDSVRRLGNEFLFETMALENVRLFREKGVVKVVTQCPHCFSTLKNDYRQYGLELEVIHHSELIGQLMVSGRLKLKQQVEALGKILLHDSCYLGRHNGIYRPPREVVEAATGSAVGEFDRQGKESFCCGAGGGRMWLEERSSERINISRLKEALDSKPDTICVACPYCMTMFEDALKDCQVSGQTRILDIAEVVAKGLSA